jgi:hypothetical protein
MNRRRTRSWTRPIKPAVLTRFALAAWTVVVLAGEQAPPKLSEHIKQEVLASLPPYVPPPPKAAASPAAQVPAADPDLLVLPKIVVQEKRPPANDPDVWLADREIQQKAMAAYKGSMTDLEWVLNSWFIPILSAPASVRARAAYESNKLAAERDRLGNLIRAVGLTDPNAARKLKDAMDYNKLPKDD